MAAQLSPREQEFHLLWFTPALLAKLNKKPVVKMQGHSKVQKHDSMSVDPARAVKLPHTFSNC